MIITIGVEKEIVGLSVKRVLDNENQTSISSG